jgi:hypothetical protein
MNEIQFANEVEKKTEECAQTAFSNEIAEIKNAITLASERGIFFTTVDVKVPTDYEFRDVRDTLIYLFKKAGYKIQYHCCLNGYMTFHISWIVSYFLDDVVE